MSNGPSTRAPTSKDITHKTSWIVFITQVILVIFTAPYRRTFKLYTWKPLRDIRAADGDRKLLVARVKDWKADKYQELQSVQVAASFCAGATLATLSWSKFENPIWAADALWFSSLICSIWAVITSIQTKSILDDLPNKDQLNSSLPEIELKRMRRVILRYKKRPGINHWIMLFIWQFPSMTMSYAWCTFLSGLTVYVCTPFIRNDPWSNRSKIAITYLSVGTVGLFTYVFSSGFVYAGEKDYERSVASTRTNTNDMESALIDSTISARSAEGTRQQQPSEPNNPVEQLRNRGLLSSGTEERQDSERTKKQLLY
ncbi:uncharacterized protein BDR25DRAFT_339387 [Lindgomyces ingoldianus]|uniref:Uncharacterized protein n=1 Tax=Lindgomyces ingoldianus TaxID=673940 RepID=A0ACB6RDE7_9PLEO|nr:uncharacterized protein BDR25DRAFT_339387 [Lindgomyces ingoldianus]KAF2476345.1 hypothetical protein BDR25DRAFT_339387 [Lindgomyces ingoldianus]